MQSLSISVPPPFRLRDVVHSHGWFHLKPFHWDEAAGVLSRIERLSAGQVVRLHVTAGDGGVSLSANCSQLEMTELEERARWMLVVDESFAAFHALCAEVPGLRQVVEHGQGRILRCPSVWEDLVKTLFSVNTTWRQTVAMTANLVERYGVPFEGAPGGFPSPSEIASANPDELQRTCRVGYRAGPLVKIAQAVASGETDLEALRERGVTPEAAEGALRKLPGIGPYAAANMLMLLGHYDHLPVDSWFRQTVRTGWFNGMDVPDAELIAAFDRFRPYRTLVYRFYNWEAVDA